GTGDLTLELALRCAQLLASDFSSDAIGLAQQRLQHHAHVTLRQAAVPGDWPAQQFDLIILSEFAFYLSDSDLQALQRQAVDSLGDDGTLVACHWRRPFVERTQATQTIHGWFDQHPALTRLSHHEEADFLLDVWSKSPASVAQQEGFA
ncbi:MAG: class I SAM-dependent methyltransferase, partial [Janthinobacterium lividum]